jgi:hypothetical protein
MRAIVPARILRKWDALAAAQLFEAAPLVAAELDKERSARQFAEDCAHMWQDISEIRERNGEVGMTVDGQIVEVRANA